MRRFVATHTWEALHDLRMFPKAPLQAAERGGGTHWASTGGCWLARRTSTPRAPTKKSSERRGHHRRGPENTADHPSLGAVGGGAHASDEHIFLSKLPERAALLALLLAAPPEVANHRQDAVGQNKDSEDQDRKGVQ